MDMAFDYAGAEVYHWECAKAQTQDHFSQEQLDRLESGRQHVLKECAK